MATKAFFKLKKSKQASRVGFKYLKFLFLTN